MRKFLFFLFCVLFSANVFAIGCNPALPTNDKNFCRSFELATECYCLADKHSPAVCSDMNALYNLMMMRYWTLKKACKSQDKVPVQLCIDSWKCYRDGGKDSSGRLCSSTGRSCV